MSHTPGPWKRDNGVIVAGVTREGDPLVIAVPVGTNKRNIAIPFTKYEDYAIPPKDEAAANANLIAAATELLDALKEMLDLYIWDSDASDRAKAAIAKAEGRTQ